MIKIPPGSIIGILGGGQLGRMLAIAAASLGYRCHVYCPENNPPACHVSYDLTTAEYKNNDALDLFSKSVDIVTYEFENIPITSIQRLRKNSFVRPDELALSTTQDRLLEKLFVANLGIETAPFETIEVIEDLTPALMKLGGAAVLKTRTLGYDGKGQVLINAPNECEKAWCIIGKKPAILEQIIHFDCEISMIAARSEEGKIAAYPPIENHHINQILNRSNVPAKVNPAVVKKAIEITKEIICSLNYVGLLAVEMFVSGDEVLVNEIAPRVHNSGHWTLEGAVTSQFEQHIRAICGLPLGSAEVHGNVLMQNLIGDSVKSWETILGKPYTHLHLYGKDEIRKDRKMGHYTVIKRRQGV